MAQEGFSGQVFSSNVISGDARVHVGNVTHNHNDSNGALWEWVNPPDVHSSHEESRRKHESTTGAWLLESYCYRQWKLGHERHLWLYGSAGSGKTILFSTVVADLQDNMPLPGSLAFFYFSFADTTRQSYGSILRSLVFQFTRSDHGLQVLRIAKEESKGLSVPSRKVLEDILVKVMSASARAYVCIDALDECPENALREDLFRGLGVLLGRVPQMKLFVTSRKLSDVEEELCVLGVKSLAIDKEQANADIARYVKMELLTHRNLCKLSQSDKDLIVKTIAEKAGGMFRLAFCLMQNLKRLKVLSIEENVRNALADLPKDLDETYDRMLRRISYMTQIEQKIASVALRWLVAAQETWTTRLLLDACIKSGCGYKGQLNAGHLCEILADLVSVRITVQQRHCFLLLWDSEDYPYEAIPEMESVEESRIELAHFSVKEYLVSGRAASDVGYLSFNEPEAHKFVTGICCATLRNDDIELSPIQIICLILAGTDSLFAYAAKYWSYHGVRHLSSNLEAEGSLVTSTNGRSILLQLHDNIIPAASEPFWTWICNIEIPGTAFYWEYPNYIRRLDIEVRQLRKLFQCLVARNDVCSLETRMAQRTSLNPKKSKIYLSREVFGISLAGLAEDFGIFSQRRD